MKYCKYCKCTKDLSEFYKKKTGKFGVKAECKLCSSLYEKIRWGKNKLTYIYSDEKKERRRNYYLINKTKVLEQSKKWAKENSYKKRICCAFRRTAILNATPYWANINAINEIYKQASMMSKVNNVKYEVDHIIPLQGKNVCGLHNEFNLQILTMTENRIKATKYEG